MHKITKLAASAAAIMYLTACVQTSSPPISKTADNAVTSATPVKTAETTDTTTASDTSETTPAPQNPSSNFYDVKNQISNDIPTVNVAMHYPQFTVKGDQKDTAIAEINKTVRAHFDEISAKPLYDGTTNTGLETYSDTYEVVANNVDYISVLFKEESYNHGDPYPVKSAYALIFDVSDGSLLDPGGWRTADGVLTAEGLNRPTAELTELGIIVNGKLSPDYTSAYRTDEDRLGLIYSVPHAAGDYLIVEKPSVWG